MTTVFEALKSAQFVVDATGRQVAVQLSPTTWPALLAWAETAEGVPTIEELISSAVNEDRGLVNAAPHLSEPALAQVWDNPEDDIYNDL